MLGWLLAAIVCAGLYPGLKAALSAPDYTVDGSESAQVESLLGGAGFHGAGSEQDAIVFFSREHRVTDPAYRVVVSRVMRAARSRAGVVGVDSPYAGPPAGRISADQHAAVAHVALAGDARERFSRAEGLQAAVAQANGAGVSAWMTGFSPLAKDLAQTESRDGERAETIGVPVALLVLLLALGALSAALVPLLISGAGLLLTFGLMAGLENVLRLDAFMLTIVTMIGIGIGIDYSLFIVSRFREELARSPETPRGERRRNAQAVGVALATSGRTILYSGTIVGLSLTSVLVIPAPIFREFVVGTAATVLCTLLAALTLLPAMLAHMGRRINAGSLPARMQPSNIRRGELSGQGGWARWALAMMRRPIVVALCVSALLFAAAGSISHLRYGINLDVPALSSTPSGKASQVLARSFSPGAMGPLEVVVTDASRAGEPISKARSDPAKTAASSLARELRGDRRVAGSAIKSYPTGVLLTVLPAVAVDSLAAGALVHHVRSELAPAVEAQDGVTALVGGWTAQGVDASNVTSGMLPDVLAITLGLAFVFLLVVFRSLVLPIKAIAMNLLATSATLGLVVLIFQDGHGQGLLGFSSAGFIQTFLPLSMFVLLFGLSMDYEVFLIRRMQEAWQETGDNRRAVASGVEHTARPISAAAAIMVAVFGSFVTANILELKEFGFALAAAIAIDATLIRLMLVPSLMCLLGERNWWLPKRLARRLPLLEVD